MSRHWGRTELAKILALLALATVLLTLPGWAYDFSEAARITNEETGVTSGAYLYEGPATEYVTGDEVAALLERCLEYVRDGDRNYLEGSIYDTLLYVEPYRTLKDDARDKLNALDRETKLRRDIEALLKKMKGE